MTEAELDHADHQMSPLNGDFKEGNTEEDQLLPHHAYIIEPALDHSDLQVSPLKDEIKGDFDEDHLVPNHCNTGMTSSSSQLPVPADPEKKALFDEEARVELVAPSNPGVDGPWAWLVLVCSFFLLSMSLGLPFCVSVFYVEWLDTFQASRSATSWVGSINVGIVFLGGPIASAATNRFGYRATVMLGGLIATCGMVISGFAQHLAMLYFSYGIIAGFGQSLVYLPSVIICGVYFDKYRKFAMGFSVAGVGVGTLVYPTIIRYLITMYGWQGAIMLTGGICLQACVLGALLRPLTYWTKKKKKKKAGSRERKPDNETKGSANEGIGHLSLFKDPIFNIFMVNNFLWNMAINSWYNLVGDVASAYMSDYQGALLISGQGVASIVGRVLIGVVTNQLHSCSPFWIYNVSTLTQGIAIGLLPLHKVFATMFALSTAFGFFFGFQIGVLAMVTSDLFGPARLSSAFGYILVADGLGALVGPPVIGWIRDSMGSYELAFVIAGSFSLLSAATMALEPMLRRCVPKPSNEDLSMEVVVEEKPDAI